MMLKWIGAIMGNKIVYSFFISLVNSRRPFLSYCNFAIMVSFNAAGRALTIGIEIRAGLNDYS